MPDGWRKGSFVAIAVIQILFFVVFLCFREIILTGDPLFHPLTSEEWEWLCQRPHDYQDLQVMAIVYPLASIFSTTTWICCARHYIALFKSRHLRASDILIPILGLALYAPLFYYIKYRAEHYYLWMGMVPAEVLSLILLCLLLSSRKREG